MMVQKVGSLCHNVCDKQNGTFSSLFFMQVDNRLPLLRFVSPNVLDTCVLGTWVHQLTKFSSASRLTKSCIG